MRALYWDVTINIITVEPLSGFVAVYATGGFVTDMKGEEMKVGHDFRYKA